MARKRTRSEAEEEESRRDIREAETRTYHQNMNEEEVEGETSNRMNIDEELRGPGGEGIVIHLAVLLVIYCSASFRIMQSCLLYIAVGHLE